jgi:16S rRNA A1518/A1519 N6-dimethyltransferase RsmA/KsgA/DIM1 with predicted DNA glycosylase/AP lyase activity
MKKQIDSAFDILELKKGDTLLELGSGDGKILISAARNGYKAIGYELNPILFVISIIRTLPYRKNIKIYCRNFWNIELPQADAIYTFLLKRQMERLDSKLEKYSFRPVKLVSFAFKIPNKKISKQKNGVFLYEYN